MTFRQVFFRLVCLIVTVQFGLISFPGVVVADTSAVTQYQIINGTNVTGNKYPWMVAVLDPFERDSKKARICGGTLIARSWVLTAAHCVSDSGSQQVKIGVGSVIIGRLEKYSVSEILIHRDFAKHGYRDIALLKLQNPVPESIKPIELIGRDARLQPGTEVTSIGWGATKFARKPSDMVFPGRLQEVKLIVENYRRCKNHDDQVRFYPLHELCIVSPSKSAIVCKKDSGGPAVIRNPRTRKYVQVGIVSWSTFNCNTRLASVQTRLSGLVDWIKRQIGNSAANNETLISPAEILEYCDGRRCLFDGSYAIWHDPRKITQFSWATDDGGRLVGPKAKHFEHQFSTIGRHHVTLRLTYKHGQVTVHRRLLDIKRTSVQPDRYRAIRIYKGFLSGEDDYDWINAVGFGVYHLGGRIDLNLSKAVDNDFSMMLYRYYPDTNEFDVIANSLASGSGDRLSGIFEPGLYSFYVKSNAGTGRFSLKTSLTRSRRDVCLTDSFLNCRR